MLTFEGTGGLRKLLTLLTNEDMPWQNAPHDVEMVRATVVDESHPKFVELPRLSPAETQPPGMTAM